MTEITVNGKQIEWNKANMTATAEASTLGLPPGAWPVTINIVSHKTGETRTWKRSLGTWRDEGCCYRMLTPTGFSRDWQLFVFNT